MIFVSQTCVLRLLAVAFVASSTVSAVSIRCARSEGKDCAFSQFHPEIAMGNELEVNSEAYIDSVPVDPFSEALSNQKVVEAQFFPGIFRKMFKKKKKAASEEEASTPEELAPADTSAGDSSGNEGAGNTGPVEADLGSTSPSEQGQTEEGSTEAGHEDTIEESYTGDGNEEDGGNEDDVEEGKGESEEVSAEGLDGERNGDNYGSSEAEYAEPETAGLDFEAEFDSAGERPQDVKEYFVNKYQADTNDREAKNFDYFDVLHDVANSNNEYKERKVAAQQKSSNQAEEVQSNDNGHQKFLQFPALSPSDASSASQTESLEHAVPELVPELVGASLFFDREPLKQLPKNWKLGMSQVVAADNSDDEGGESEEEEEEEKGEYSDEAKGSDKGSGKEATTKKTQSSSQKIRVGHPGPEGTTGDWAYNTRVNSWKQVAESKGSRFFFKNSVLIAFLLGVLTLCKGLQIGVVRPQDTDTAIQKRSDNDRTIQMHDIGIRNYYSKPGSEALVEQRDLNIFETRAAPEIFEAKLSTSSNNEKSDGGSLGLELTFNTGFNIGLRLRPTRTKQKIKKILFYLPKKVIKKTQQYLGSLKDSNGSYSDDDLGSLKDSNGSYSDDDLLYSDESASCSGTCHASGQSICHSNCQRGKCKHAIKSSAYDEEIVLESCDQHNEEDCHFFTASYEGKDGHPQDEDQNEYSSDEECKKDSKWEETLQKEEYQTDDEDDATLGYQSDEEYVPPFAHHIAVLGPALKNPDSKNDIFRKIESEIGFFSVSPQSFEYASSMGSVIRPLLQNSYLNAYKKVAALPEIASNTAEGPEFDKESDERTLKTEDRHSSVKTK
ncbi:hypothetical protein METBISCDRAFT_21116 [Metschnikowia bicuspidata]|uniref:Uncharacterized protein n=1 Tax=Metschnikowia bicuspidata TaxID=27322 RepID=A0A4P9ZIK6_9ASCO|nr:hypothetical protein METBISCDRAFT_21116 [Metschnikowia bicuspidata]